VIPTFLFPVFLLPSFWFTVHIISGYEPDRYGLNSFPLFEFRHLYICRRFQIFKAITKQRKWSHENSSVDVWKFPKDLWGFEPAIFFSWGKLMTTVPRLQGAKVWSGGHFLGTASRLTSTSTYVPTNIHANVCTWWWHDAMDFCVGVVVRQTWISEHGIEILWATLEEACLKKREIFFQLTATLFYAVNRGFVGPWIIVPLK
jgi:hypothetical protein